MCSDNSEPTNEEKPLLNKPSHPQRDILRKAKHYEAIRKYANGLSISDAARKLKRPYPSLFAELKILEFAGLVVLKDKFVDTAMGPLPYRLEKTSKRRRAPLSAKGTNPSSSMIKRDGFNSFSINLLNSYVPFASSSLVTRSHAV